MEWHSGLAKKKRNDVSQSLKSTVSKGAFRDNTFYCPTVILRNCDKILLMSRSTKTVLQNV